MIKGTIVSLRPLEPEDVEPLRAIGNEDFISSKICRHWLVSKTEMALWSERLPEKNDCVYLVIVSHYGNFEGVAGMIGLRKIDWINRKGELTMFLHPVVHGKGFGTESLLLFCKYCFGRLNLNKVFVNVLDHNAAAIRAYEKAGFSEEGLLKNEVYMNGCFNNMKRMAKFA